ncbi:MAG: molybdopterin-dependent oxidoreductase, partial [Acidimicrobiia bacterium]|nr:molybdopterin-dependent oxidoreductase [Acidimicrobiia bacterium]
MNQTPAWLGQAIRRKEDHRLLTGLASYLADLRLSDTVEMAVLRSPLAHAIIRSVDTTKAQALDGVILVVTGEDLVGSVRPFTEVAISSPPIVEERSNMKLGPFKTPVVAIDKVVRAGEIVAVVVAVDRYVAEDALELIEMDLDPLPVVVDPEDALKPDAPVIHEQMTSNLHASFTIEVGDPDGALTKSPHVIRDRFVFGRSVGSPIENRGVLSSYDPAQGTVTHWSTTQRSHWLRGYISSMLSIAESDVRVIAPEMGGSFGSGLYPEDIIAAHLTMRLGKPVRWLEDRRENLLNARHARDQIHDVEVGFDDEGRILVLRDHFIQDCGAHNPYGVTISYNTAANLRGQFHIPAFLADVRCVLTNKTPNTPVRGAGRPEAVFV